MTNRIAALLLFLCATLAAGQETSTALAKGRIERSVFVSGAAGVPPGDAPGTGMFAAGFRLGRIMTGEHGGGWLRGNLQVAIDVIPVYVINKDRTVYGAGINPLVSKWNFTSHRSVTPFVELASGVLLTSNIIPGGFSRINFTTGLGGGVQFFRDRDHAIALGGRFAHISNAGLEPRNPAINVFQATLAYQWWR